MGNIRCTEYRRFDRLGTFYVLNQWCKYCLVSETGRSISVEGLIRNILNLGHLFRNLYRLKNFLILALTAIFFGRAKPFLAIFGEAFFGTLERNYI